MILVDTSVWVDHLRRGDALLQERLLKGEVLTHPFVMGEIACGALRERGLFLDLMKALPGVSQARDVEVMRMIEAKRLWGLGAGWVDMHLLAACRLSNCRLWTRDKCLRAAAAKAGVRVCAP